MHMVWHNNTCVYAGDALEIHLCDRAYIGKCHMRGDVGIAPYDSTKTGALILCTYGYKIPTTGVIVVRQSQALTLR